MHNYYKKNNVSLLNNLNSASKVAEYRKKARGRLTSSHLYNYCSNNSVRYIDVTGLSAIQKKLGVKIIGAVQKPWHLVINGKEIPINPLNPNWKYFR